LKKHGFKQAMFLRNEVFYDHFVVARQLRLTKFLPAYKRTKEKCLPWNALFCAAAFWQSLISRALEIFAEKEKGGYNG